MQHAQPVRRRPAHRWHLAVFAVCVLCTLLMASCLSAASEGNSSDPLKSPTFLTPVAEAGRSGVTAHWMGEEFQAGSVSFKLNAVARSFPKGDEYPGLQVRYGGDVGIGTVIFDVETFTKQGEGAEVSRETVAAVPGATSQHVVVGLWEAELFLVPGPVRSINKVILFVELGDMIIVGRAHSGTSSTSGEELNPLIDSDLLIEVVAEHLRPYPE